MAYLREPYGNASFCLWAPSVCCFMLLYGSLAGPYGENPPDIHYVVVVVVVAVAVAVAVVVVVAVVVAVAAAAVVDGAKIYMAAVDNVC